jgi:hypothetical protein
MAKGNKPVPPPMNRKPPAGKHVPSAVAGAKVMDNSAEIAKHVTQQMPCQSTQTVGTNPDAPAERQASGQVASGIPYTSGSPTGYSPYMGVY